MLEAEEMQWQAGRLQAFLDKEATDSASTAALPASRVPSVPGKVGTRRKNRRNTLRKKLSQASYFRVLQSYA